MRDPQKQHKFANSFKVLYPDFPTMNSPVRSVTVIQEMGKHDIVQIYYPRFSKAFFKAVKTGVPVRVSWKNDKVGGEFVGYTVDVSYPTIQQLVRGVTITCVGSSYPLKERTSKIWKNKTASEIATEIAKKFKLKPFVTASPIRFTQQSLSGHSYWEKLNELATKIGYGVQVVGTELHFHPIDQMIDQFMTTIPIMSFKDPLFNPQSSFIGPTLEYFEPTVGDNIESAKFSRTNNIVSGVDPVTGKSYKAVKSSNKTGKSLRKDTKDPLFSSIETHTVVASNSMATALSNARAQLGRLTIPAKAIGQGDPRIAPWRTVEIKGTGDTTDGFWVVEKAEHVIHGDGRYAVEFTCVSDGVGTNKPSNTRPSNAGSVPTRNIKNEMATANKRKPTASKLSATTILIKQSGAGYKVTPRKWSGK
jgi:hypothetical protein